MNVAMRIAVALGFAGILVYYTLLCLFKNERIADEDIHMPAIVGIAQGDWTETRQLPMLPTYHWLAALTAPVDAGRLALPRLVTVAFSLAAILSYAALQKRLRSGAAPGGAAEADSILQFAWNPLWFPFTALVYTDAPTTAFVMMNLWLHLRGAYLSGALALLAAGAVRQTSIIWAVWIALFEAIRLRSRHGVSGENTTMRRFGEWLRRVWPYGLLLCGGALAGAYFGRLTFGRSEWNRLGFNPAQLYLFAICIIMMWFPLILANFAAVWRDISCFCLTRPLGIAGLLGVYAFLVVNYRSTHGWNADLWYVRNWPLEAMAHSMIWRVLIVGILVAAIPVFVAVILRQRQKEALLLTFVVSIGFLSIQELAEPRYYILPTMVVNLLLEPGRRIGRLLTGWYALLSAAIAGCALSIGGLGGGVW